MHRPVEVTHNSFMEGSHMTKNMTSAYYKFVSNSGLTSEAALESLKNYGMNKIASAPETPEWLNFLKHFFDGFYLLLWTESFICFAGETPLYFGRQAEMQAAI